MVYKLLKISWSEMKTLKAESGYSLTYTQVFSNPNNYKVFLSTSQVQAYSYVKEELDITDFESNYKTTSISSNTPDGALAFSIESQATATQYSSLSPETNVRCMDVIQRSGVSICKDESVFAKATTTISSNTANRQILTYTVPSNKTFYLLGFFIGKTQSSAVQAMPAKLRVNGVDFMSWGMYASTSDTPKWIEHFPQGIPIAISSQVIDLAINQSANNATIWSGAIWGFIR